MGLLVTLFLIMVNTYTGNINSSISTEFGLMAIYMLGCEITVSEAMAEYGFLLYRSKFTKTVVSPDPKMETKPKINLDKHCLVIIPVLFAIFNLCFWTFVTSL